MRIGSDLPPAGDALQTAEAPRERAGEAPSTPVFSALLAQRLREPRDRIELTRDALRAAIDAVRPGAAFAPAGAVAEAPAPNAGTYSAGRAYPRATVDGADTFGWRDLTRRLGDQIVGPGFGDIFEAQIQQESGFDPEVVFGYRRSSAGAEGIAQLMPQYYAGVNRRDPEASLNAAAQSMRHYLAANEGDVRKALASYNAGLGTVQSLVAAHGAQWERGLPAETKQYLAGILGGAAPSLDARGGSRLAFGGRGPHGVLTSPLDGATGRQVRGALEFLGDAGSIVRAPSDGVVLGIEGSDGARGVRLDHGNGWTSLLDGLGASAVSAGDLVRRGQALGNLGGASGAPGALRLALQRAGQAVDPRAYLLDVAALRERPVR